MDYAFKESKYMKVPLFWNKLQKKMNFFTRLHFFLDVTCMLRWFELADIEKI